MIQLLKDKVAIVASCSDAVALSTSRLFLQQGASVMITGSYPEFSEDTPEFSDSSQWAWLQADMTDAMEARYGVSETLKRFGCADIFFYYPDTEEDGALTSSDEPDQAVITHVKNLWSGLAATLPLLRATGGGNIIVVAGTSSDSELSHVGDIQTEEYCIKVDLINALQSYYPKRQQSLMAHKQLTPERIARLALSLLIKEKQEEAEWNEVLSWTSEYLDAAF